MNRIIIGICFFVFGFSSTGISQRFASIRPNANFDSLLQKATHPASDTEKLYAYASLCENFFEPISSTTDSLIDMLKEVIAINNRLEILDSRPYEEILAGEMLWQQNQYDSALSDFKRGIALFDEQKRIMGIQSFLFNLRSYYGKINRQEEKIKYYTEKLDYYTEYGPIENTAACYQDIASYYINKGDYNRAITEFLRGGEVYKTFEMPGYANGLLLAGYYYIQWGNRETGVDYLEKAYAAGAPIKYWFVMCNAKLYLSSIYDENHQYRKAIRDADTAFMAARQDSSLSGYRAIIDAYVGNIYIDSNRLELGKKYLDASVPEARKWGIEKVYNPYGYYEINYYYYPLGELI